MGLYAFGPADEPDEETRDRIFHLHDDPKDCDDPETHYGPGSGLTGDEEKE